MIDLNGDKASRPNGYAFWKFSWEVVKDDIMKLFKEFYET